MKTNRFSKIIAAVVVVGTSVLWTACTDTWNEHYDVTAGGMADQPTLLENIKSDAALANFYRVIAAIGGEETLNSPQQLTVWAPKGLTTAQADSVIAVYQDGVSKGLKWEDNKAVQQFFQNHVALYARTISSLTDDTISLMNKKYMRLRGTSASTGFIGNNPFDEAVLCCNGMLYKTASMQHFFPNVREYLEQQTRLDSVASLIAKFDEYELDEQSSVAGGIVDGKTIYLDSVTVLSNDLLSAYGYIQREDSIYSMVVPTNEVWTQQYEKYRNYYQYDPTVMNADSLTDINARLSIVCGRFFNTSMDNKYNRHPEDSLVNTAYSERQLHNPRKNVYYRPFDSDGILNGLEKVECSNGFVYVDNKGVIDPHTTFFGRSDIEANFARYYEVPKNANGDDRMDVYGGQYLIYDSDTTYNIEKYYNYVEVRAKTASEQSEIMYKLPSTLSDVYYNVYLVTVPDNYTNLPCWFQVKHSEKNAKGNFPSASSYENPRPITLDDSLTIANVDVILAQTNNKRCYVASAEKVDTVLIQTAVKYDYSGVGLDEGVVRLTIGSFGPSSATMREKIYTRTLRLNEIILVPFETKEEAEAAADDLDAFNDELLEANKEN